MYNKSCLICENFAVIAAEAESRQRKITRDRDDTVPDAFKESFFVVPCAPETASGLFSAGCSDKNVNRSIRTMYEPCGKLGAKEAGSSGQ